jgi:hypothetical protein
LDRFRGTQKEDEWIGGLAQRITDGKDKNRTKKLGRMKRDLKENEEKRWRGKRRSEAGWNEDMEEERKRRWAKG